MTEAAIHWDQALATLREAKGIPAVIGLELLAENAEAATAAPGAAAVEATPLLAPATTPATP